MYVTIMGWYLNFKCFHMSELGNHLSVIMYIQIANTNTELYCQLK